jgi:hypothetical protein
MGQGAEMTLSAQVVQVALLPLEETMSHASHRIIVALIVLYGLIALSGTASGAISDYKFINLIDNTGPISSFRDSIGLADDGTVVFIAAMDSGETALMTVDSIGTLTTVRPAMCERDEGRPLAAGLRKQAANHLERRWLRARVVSVKERA